MGTCFQCKKACGEKDDDKAMYIEVNIQQKKTPKPILATYRLHCSKECTAESLKQIAEKL